MADNYVSINMVILGNEGHGKSSVGNFILNQQTFAVSRENKVRSFVRSFVQTYITRSRRPCYASGNRSTFTLKVVDMPACPAVPQEQLQSSYRKMIGEAFDRCEDKLHLFLLVIKFENENTGNCLQVIDNWRHILGPDIFANWGVIVMTFGDEFTRSMEKKDTNCCLWSCDEKRGTEEHRGDLKDQEEERLRQRKQNQTKEFLNWCWDRGGDLLKLIEECSWRIVLVDDTADRDQKERTFVEFSDYMPDLPRAYSKQYFKKFTNYQKVLALHGESSDHTRDIQKELYSLTIDFMRLRDHPSTIKLLDIEERLEGLTKKQTLLSKDENKRLSLWKREITDVKCKVSETNRTLIKSAAGKMLRAASPTRTWPEVLTEHVGCIVIVLLAIACAFFFTKQSVKG